jgi:hypothetical protein
MPTQQMLTRQPTNRKRRAMYKSWQSNAARPEKDNERKLKRDKVKP